LKVAVVTARVTFVPENYRGFTRLLAEHPSVQGLAVVNNLSANLVFKTIPSLFLAGAHGMASDMTRNLLRSSEEKRREDFKRRGKWVKEIDNPNDSEFVEFARGFDLILHARTRCYFRKSLLEAPKLGCVNVHHGVLPAQKGVLCDLYALAEQVPSQPPGFSLHLMSAKLDEGPLLSVCPRPWENLDFQEYLAKGAELEGIAVCELLSRLQGGEPLKFLEANSMEAPVFRRNPSFSTLRTWRHTGLKF
jgi:methionyl-tRNA formyltransferase